MPSTQNEGPDAASTGARLPPQPWQRSPPGGWGGAGWATVGAAALVLRAARRSRSLASRAARGPRGVRHPGRLGVDTGFPRSAALCPTSQLIGLAAALTSDRLKTDGAEVLWEYKRAGGDAEVVNDLVVVRNQQIVFRDVVERYLQTITYRSGRVAIIGLPQYRTDVVVDPLRNFGRPTVARRGVRVADVLGRLSAGEPVADVALDYGLEIDEVTALTAA